MVAGGLGAHPQHCLQPRHGLLQPAIPNGTVNGSSVAHRAASLTDSKAFQRQLIAQFTVDMTRRLKIEASESTERVRHCLLRSCYATQRRSPRHDPCLQVSGRCVRASALLQNNPQSSQSLPGCVGSKPQTAVAGRSSGATCSCTAAAVPVRPVRLAACTHVAGLPPTWPGTLWRARAGGTSPAQRQKVAAAAPKARSSSSSSNSSRNHPGASLPQLELLPLPHLAPLPACSLWALCGRSCQCGAWSAQNTAPCSLPPCRCRPRLSLQRPRPHGAGSDAGD